MKEHILVVDDNPISRLALVELLGAKGYVISECDTGDGCRQAIKRGEIDLILLDVRLPDVNGIDLCREIRSQACYDKIFIGLISVSEITPDVQAAGLNLGADAYLVRPIQDFELVARIEALLRIQRAEQALRQANEQLELKIKDRTADLEHANQALQEEIEVRREAEEGQKRLTFRLQRLHSLDQAILKSRSSQQVATASLGSLQELITVDLAEVWRLDPELDELTRLACWSQKGACSDGKRRMDHDLRSFLVRLNEVENLVLTHSPNPFTQASDDSSLEAPWQRICVFPLIAHDMLLGAIVIASNHDEPFTVETIRICKEITGSLSIALYQSQLFDELSGSRLRMQEMSRQMLDIQEEERRALSLELHDEIGQNLTGIKAMLETGIKELGGGSCASLGSALEVVNELMGQVRQLSIKLRPQMLDELGLLKALVWLFHRLDEQAGLTVKFLHNATEDRLPPAMEITLFRIVQEALTNVIRHADDKRAEIRLWIEQDHCRLQIQDEGPGFDPRTKLREFKTAGLTGMIERAKLLGGELIVESTPGKGTCLTVDSPIK